jgi:hypothetical protein
MYTVLFVLCRSVYCLCVNVYCTVCFVSFCVVFVCKCVLYYYHRLATKLQLPNISSSGRGKGGGGVVYAMSLNLSFLGPMDKL